MPTCAICGETLLDGARTCGTCGTSVPEGPLLTGTVVEPPPGDRTELVHVPDVPPGGRYCPACLQIYGPDYDDAFCTCGIELVRPAALAPVEIEALPRPPAVRPTPGTPCLTLVGPERQVLQYFPLTKDVTLVGRLDAVEGIFPDIDLDAWLDRFITRKISRQHALILRNRAKGAYTLRPLAGNTGTQLETEMVLPLHDYALEAGQRIILGGAVRLKFEMA
jgi:hypothetical protein